MHNLKIITRAAPTKSGKGVTLHKIVSSDIDSVRSQLIQQVGTGWLVFLRFKDANFHEHCYAMDTIRYTEIWEDV